VRGLRGGNQDTVDVRDDIGLAKPECLLVTNYSARSNKKIWIPAFAGMTDLGTAYCIRHSGKACPGPGSGPG